MFMIFFWVWVGAALIVPSYNLYKIYLTTKVRKKKEDTPPKKEEEIEIEEPSVDIIVRDNNYKLYWINYNGVDWGSQDAVYWYAFNSTYEEANNNMSQILSRIIKCTNLNEKLTKIATGNVPVIVSGDSPYPDLASAIAKLNTSIKYASAGIKVP